MIAEKVGVEAPHEKHDLQLYKKCFYPITDYKRMQLMRTWAKAEGDSPFESRWGWWTATTRFPSCPVNLDWKVS